VVDHLVIGVAQHTDKNPLFTLQERTEMVQQEVARLKQDNPSLQTRIEVQPFETLLVDFARQVGAHFIIRGLRAVSDFEYEFQMVGMNGRLAPTIETLFLMASERFQFIASRFVKEVARLGGDVSPFVSPVVHQRLCERFA
jgi:pantetheine-phosphate adenylyltransferase